MKKKTIHTYTDREDFINSICEKYHTTPGNVFAVIEELGFQKPKIRTYFEVHAYLSKKGLTGDGVTDVMKSWPKIWTPEK